GAKPGAAEAVLRGIRVANIRCEIDTGDDVLVIGNLAGDAAAPLQQELRAGESCQFGQTRLQLETLEPTTESPPVSVYGDDDIPGLALNTPASLPPAAPAAAEPAAAGSHVTRRLFVVDGADQGRIYSLPGNGVVSIGKSHKHSEIVLNDLYVSRLH